MCTCNAILPSCFSFGTNQNLFVPINSLVPAVSRSVSHVLHPLGGAGVGLLPLRSACCLPCFFPGTPSFSKPPTLSQVRGVLVVPSSPSSDPKRLKEAGLWAGSHLAPDALPTGGIDHEVPRFPPKCHLSSRQLISRSFPSPPCLLFFSPFLGFPAPSGTFVSSKGQQMKGVAVRGGLYLSTTPWNSATSSVL